MTIEWIWEFDQAGNIGGARNMLGEFLWFVRNGSWCWGVNWPDMIVGAGRLWYDGPHWFAHFGPIGVSLSRPTHRPRAGHAVSRASEGVYAASGSSDDHART